MARQYPRFLYSNPQHTKSKGPFIIHILDPILLIKIEAVPPVVIYKTLKNPHIVKDELMYEAILSKTNNNNEILSVIYNAIKWYNKQPFYKEDFTEFFYNLIDDNAANSFVSLYKYKIDDKFIWAKHIYRVDDYENNMINCTKICLANLEDISDYPVIDHEI